MSTTCSEPLPTIVQKNLDALLCLAVELLHFSQEDLFIVLSVNGLTGHAVISDEYVC